MAKLVAADHGIDGVVDGFFATGSNAVAVRLRPSKGVTSVVTLGSGVGDGPDLQPIRFGDAPFTGVLVRMQEPVGWNFLATVYTVVEVRKAPISRARARHVHSAAMRDVAVWNLDTGVGRLESAEARPTVDGGSELVQVACGAWFPDVKKKPSGPCDSTNRIFFVRDDTWWWDELRGKSCLPRNNGYCYPVSPLPAPSEFPPSIAPAPTSTGE